MDKLYCLVQLRLALLFSTTHGGVAAAECVELVREVRVLGINHTISSDVSVVGVSEASVEYEAIAMPLLATFSRRGGAYLQRLVRKIDFPLKELAILQDGDDPAVVRAIDDVIAELSALPAATCMIRCIRHVIHPGHVGVAGMWNQAVRLHPAHSFWPMISDDVFFEPGMLQLFYAALRAPAVRANASVGAVAAQIRFPGRRSVRKTFGCMAWAITRAGVLRAGLYDENYFPMYYEDDDHVRRLRLAGLDMYALKDVVAFHGNASQGSWYVSGTHLMQAAQGVRSAAMAVEKRSTPLDWHHFKWGRGTNGFKYADSQATLLQRCHNAPDANKCTPYTQLQPDHPMPLSWWPLFPDRRQCILTGEGEKRGQHLSCPPRMPPEMPTTSDPGTSFGTGHGNCGGLSPYPHMHDPMPNA